LRIIGWNIRAGGGVRADAIARQLGRWEPDVVALSEYRATPPSLTLARSLAALGLPHQLTTANLTRPGDNRLLLAARWPLARRRRHAAPGDGRWLLAEVAAPRPLLLGSMHVPNRVTGHKWPFLDAVLAVARTWRRGPALLIGDTNSGRPGLDEESAAFNAREGGWIEALERAGWRDAFRHLRGEERAYTWYSPNAGNGFRLDQAFVNPGLLPLLRAARYEWGRRRPGARPTSALSDHAALLVDFA
jgi:exonuclease III